MKYFPTTLDEDESNQQANIISELISERGWGFWAVELKATGQFIGFVGLHHQDQASGIPFTPFIEVGWRLASEFWGKGYATEAAKKALEFAFEHLSAPCVYAFTASLNKPSQRVMSKINMLNTDADFNHPKLTRGHILERHCLYSITKNQWMKVAG
ncbi:GNAT family N-acetyltransferase [Vibrio ostreicida]